MHALPTRGSFWGQREAVWGGSPACISQICSTERTQTIDSAKFPFWHPAPPQGSRRYKRVTGIRGRIQLELEYVVADVEQPPGSTPVLFC